MAAGSAVQRIQRAPLERQIPAYGDYLAHYGRTPGTAADLARSDIRHHPAPLQSSIMMGAQFSPNAGLPGTPQWPQAFARGDMTSISPSPINPRTGRPATQAEVLGVPPTIRSMYDYFSRTQPR